MLNTKGKGNRDGAVIGMRLLTACVASAFKLLNCGK